MDAEIYQKHLTVGEQCGRERTCGKKIDYKSEESALKAADAMNRKKQAKGDDKRLEPYPCFWCHGWHVGRKFVSEGCTVCIPLTESQRYDLVVEIENHLCKIEVKTVRSYSVDEP